MPAQWTERTLRVSALERDEGVWRRAPGAADVAPGCHPGEQSHPSSLGSARLARCPGVNTRRRRQLAPSARSRPSGSSDAASERAAREIIRSIPMPKARRAQAGAKPPGFDAEAFLTSAGAARRVTTYRSGKIVFSQGQPSDA